MKDDDDLRAALARAHDADDPPAFSRVLAAPGRRASRRSRTPFIALASAASAAAALAFAFVVTRPPSTPPTLARSSSLVLDAGVHEGSADLAAAVVTGGVDLSSPALSSTTLTLPTDSLLVIPGGDWLSSTPALATGALP